jgi:DNA helicase-2/ATP-dependent DNA helicase PcrA
MNAGSKPVRHKLLFDEAEAMLAARFAAFLLEPRTNGAPLADLVTALELLSDIKRASGVNDAKRFREWAAKVAKGKMPKAGLVTTLASLLQELETSAYTGDPAKDWIRVKQALSRTDAPDLWKVVRQLDYLIAFNRGKRISGNLSELWQRHGRYDGAREALDRALIQDQLVGGIDDPRGVQVMTIHKAKGKQFDGIIVVREGRHNGKEQSSTFVWMGDTSPYHRSRKILRVAVTRAITHTMILNPFWPPCPILGGHKL